MRRNKCEECNGLIKEKEVDYFFLGQNLGKYKAEVCTKCGEQVFGEEVVEKVRVEVIKEKIVNSLEDNGNEED